MTMRINLKSIAMFVILVTIAVISPARAHDHDHDHDHDHEHGHHHGSHTCFMAEYKEYSGGFLTGFEDELNLSEEQVRQLKDMHKETRERVKNDKKKIFEEKEKLQDIMSREDIDMEAFRAQLKKIYDMEYEVRSEIVAGFQKARGVLTPEQKAKLPDILKAKTK